MLSRPPFTPQLATRDAGHTCTGPELAQRDWSAFWSALHGDAVPERVSRVVDVLLSGLGTQPLAPHAPWPSQISDDGTPWELSMAWTPGGIETRLLVQARRSGLEVRTPADPERRGGHICIAHPRAEAAVQALVAQGFDVDARAGFGIRIAPHPAQTEAECDAVVDAICRA